MNNSFYDYPFDTNDLINEMIISAEDNTYKSYEGYIKGNMFKNIYDQYKNKKPSKLIPNNEQAELLLNINQLCFAVQDLRLYLDIKPYDKKMIQMFNEYQTKANEAISNYERKYGPILMNSISDDNEFSWVKYNFPWEMGEL